MPSSGVQTCARSEEHTSELQSHDNLVCRLLLEKNAELYPTVLVPQGAVEGALSDRRAARRHAASSPRAREPLQPLAQSCPTEAVFFFNGPGPPEINSLSHRAPLPI